MNKEVVIVFADLWPEGVGRWRQCYAALGDICPKVEECLVQYFSKYEFFVERNTACGKCSSRELGPLRKESAFLIRNGNEVLSSRVSARVRVGSSYYYGYARFPKRFDGVHLVLGHGGIRPLAILQIGGESVRAMSAAPAGVRMPSLAAFAC